jgi:hypothetical protein
LGDDHAGSLEQYVTSLSQVSERGGVEMRIVIALGRNALRRGDPMTTQVQRRNIMIAAQAIAPPRMTSWSTMRPGRPIMIGKLVLARL